MKAKGRIVGLAIGVAVVGASPTARAGEPAHSMADLGARLQPGTEVDVVDSDGRVIRGELARADEHGILLAGFGGTEGTLVPAARVLSVARLGDSLKNGLLFGAGFGVLSAIAVATDDTGESGCTTTGCKAGLGIVIVPIYAGIGALVDKAIRGRQVVYRAPSDRVSWSVAPHPVPRGAAVRLAVRF